jgi:hypothetical protein
MSPHPMDAEIHALQAAAALDALRNPTPRLRVTCAADVPRERVEWLWEQWLPFGKLVSVDGVAECGKSTVIMDLIARATRGRPMPGSTTNSPPIGVMIAGVEDGWGDTIRPRLDAADADLSRVHFVSAARSDAQFTIPRDVPELIVQARELGVRWLHIDAIMGALDETTNANSDHEVRRALGALKDAAAEAGVLVTFIRHPRKQGGSAINAGGGSVAFTALVRVQLFVGYHPGDGSDPECPDEEKRRVLAVGKSNLAKHPASRLFNVVSSPFGVGCIGWEGECSITADELAAPPVPLRKEAGGGVLNPRTNARAFLLDRLADGAVVPLDTLESAATAAGLKWRTVQRAAGDLGVVRSLGGFPARGAWSLSTSDTLTEASATDSPAAPVVPPSQWIDEMAQMAETSSHATPPPSPDAAQLAQLAQPQGLETAGARLDSHVPRLRDGDPELESLWAVSALSGPT